MKNYKTFIHIVIITFLTSCDKETIIDQIVNFNDMPGEHINEMEIDNNNDFFYITSEIDAPVNYLSIKFSYCYILFIKKTSESGEFETLNDDFMAVNDIIFDKTNSLWARNAKTIYLKEGDTYRKIVDLPSDSGLFRFMTVDNENNIWVGGSTALYKIDSNLNVEKFTDENSHLNSAVTNIHVDKDNNIWLALWNNQGVLKIEKDKWINYNSENSNITSQNIWCLVLDKDNNLWIGTGHINKQISLMRFDGEKWETLNPPDNNNEIITGTVRKLFADENKIYMVSEKVENMAFSSNVLLTFDGTNWNKINKVPEDDGIADLKIDDFRKTVWIRTLSKGIYKLKKGENTSVKPV